MSNQTIYLTNYTVGEEAYQKVGAMTAPYGHKALVIEWQSCLGTPSKERFIEAILAADKIGQTA